MNYSYNDFKAQDQKNKFRTEVFRDMCKLAQMVMEVAKIDENNSSKMSFPIEQARQVAKAILDCADEMEKSNNELYSMKWKSHK